MRPTIIETFGNSRKGHGFYENEFYNLDRGCSVLIMSLDVI